jgi:hypothetical protein
VLVCTICSFETSERNRYFHGPRLPVILDQESVGVIKFVQLSTSAEVNHVGIITIEVRTKNDVVHKSVSGARAEVASADLTESKADWPAGSTQDDAAGSRSLCHCYWQSSDSRALHISWMSTKSSGRFSFLFLDLLTNIPTPSKRVLSA